MDHQGFLSVARELCEGFVYRADKGFNVEHVQAVHAALEEAYRIGFAEGKEAGLREASTPEGN